MKILITTPIQEKEYNIEIDYSSGTIDIMSITRPNEELFNLISSKAFRDDAFRQIRMKVASLYSREQHSFRLNSLRYLIPYVSEDKLVRREIEKILARLSSNTNRTQSRFGFIRKYIR